jgi:hypothetical protein
MLIGMVLSHKKQTGTPPSRWLINSWDSTPAMLPIRQCFSIVTSSLMMGLLNN